MTRSTLCVAALLSFTASGAIAHEYRAGAIRVDHPMAFETPPTAMSGGGYMTITNEGETEDRLVGIRGDFPRLELHTTMETDGIVRISHVDAIAIPAGETVTLAPGGLHVMFMGLNGDPFEPGERIPATLLFEHAGELDVVFTVEERQGNTKGQKHQGH